MRLEFTDQNADQNHRHMNIISALSHIVGSQTHDECADTHGPTAQHPSFRITNMRMCTRERKCAYHVNHPHAGPRAQL